MKAFSVSVSFTLLVSVHHQLMFVVVHDNCSIDCRTLLFFAFGFFKSGNIAGDSEKLADREERVIEVTPDKHGEKRGRNF